MAKDQKINPAIEWFFSDKGFNKVMFLVIIVALFGIGYGYYRDIGFQPENEVCNNPIMLPAASPETLEIGEKVGRKKVIIDKEILDNGNRVDYTLCGWKDWREKTEEEKKIDECEILIGRLK